MSVFRNVSLLLGWGSSWSDEKKNGDGGLLWVPRGIGGTRLTWLGFLFPSFFPSLLPSIAERANTPKKTLPGLCEAKAPGKSFSRNPLLFSDLTAMDDCDLEMGKREMGIMGFLECMACNQLNAS